MHHTEAAQAGRIEDKWLEFVVAEYAARPRQAARQQRLATAVKRAEVQASYFWLLAAAMLAWCIS